MRTPTSLLLLLLALAPAVVHADDPPALKPTPAAVAPAATAPAAAPAGVTLVGAGGSQSLTAERIAALPRTKVTTSEHGTPAVYEGAELAALLALVNAPAGEHLRGKELTKYVLVEAADGYRAVFALAETDPLFTDRKIILADRRDGKALSEKEGPFRIVVSEEKRQARCVRQVVKISIVAAN